MKNPDDSEESQQNPVVSLGDLLKDGVSVAALATAIEKKGIFAYDRFGRFLPADANGKAQAEALDLLAAMYAWTIGEYLPESEEIGSPIEWHEKAGDNSYELFGWLEQDVPNFDELMGDIHVKEVILDGGKRQKASVSFVTLFVPLLVEIVRRDHELDISRMHGVKNDLHDLAKKYNVKFNGYSESTFSDYLEGYCKFGQGNRPSDYYKKLFPDLFK
jgi:hypothetical protein